MVRSSWSGGIWGAVLLVVSAVVTVLQTRLAIVYLNQEQSGVWFLILGFSSLLILFDFGISNTLTRELGFALHDNVQRQNLMHTATRLLQVLGLIVWCLATPLGALYLSGIVSSQALTTVLQGWLMFSLGAAFSLQSNVFSASLIGLGLMAKDRQARSVWLMLSLGLVFMLLQGGFGLNGLCLGWSIGQMGLCITLWAMLRRERRGGQYSSQLAQHLWRVGLRWWWMAIGGYLILNTDNYVIATVLGTSAIADYTLLARLSSLVMPFSFVFVSSAVPIIAQASAQKDTATIVQLLFLHVRIGFLILIPILTLLSCLPETLLHLWVGEGHFLGYPLLLVFLTMLTLEVHHVLCATVLMATGKLPFAPWAIGAGLLNLVFSFVLAAPLGLLGVALGTMLAQLLTNNWFAPLITLRSLQVSPQLYVQKVLLPIALSLLVCLGVGGLIRQTILAWSDSLQIAIFAVWMLCCVLVAGWLLFSKNERSHLLGRIFR
jgi:O-antigen/teichoic acid export membrane protein